MGKAPVIASGTSAASIKIYTTKDIADIFGMGKNKANDLMRSPAFPSVRIGGVHYVEENALLKWMKTYEGREFLL